MKKCIRASLWLLLPLLAATALLSGCAAGPNRDTEPTSDAAQTSAAAQTSDTDQTSDAAQTSGAASGSETGTAEAYMTVFGCPDTIFLPGEMDEYAAAERLAAIFLDGQAASDPSRTFRLTEYRDLTVEVCPSSEARQTGRDWGIPGDSEYIADDTWLVYISASFRFEGLYSPIGPPTEGLWYSSLGQGSAFPLLLTKTDGGYTLFSIPAR